MKNISDTWEFVEKYYPKYSSCNEIAENDDLQKIVDGEINGYAEVIYNQLHIEASRNYGGSSLQIIEQNIKDLAQQKLNESNAYIFEKAIEGYIESLKSEAETNKFAVYWSVEDFEAKAKSMFEDLKDSEPMEFLHLDNWEQFYDKSKFPEKLEQMINRHDANDGITWLTVEEYVGTCEIRKNTNE